VALRSDDVDAADEVGDELDDDDKGDREGSNTNSRRQSRLYSSDEERAPPHAMQHKLVRTLESATRAAGATMFSHLHVNSSDEEHRYPTTVQVHTSNEHAMGSCEHSR